MSSQSADPVPLVKGPPGWICLGQGPRYLSFRHPVTQKRFGTLQEVAAFLDLHFPALVVLTMVHPRCDLLLYPDEDSKGQGPPSLRSKRRNTYKMPSMPFREFCWAYMHQQIPVILKIKSLPAESVAATWKNKSDRVFLLGSEIYREPTFRASVLTKLQLQQRPEFRDLLSPRTGPSSSKTMSIFADHSPMPLQTKTRDAKTMVRFTDWVVRMGLERHLAYYTSPKALAPPLTDTARTSVTLAAPTPALPKVSSPAVPRSAPAPRSSARSLHAEWADTKTQAWIRRCNGRLLRWPDEEPPWEVSVLPLSSAEAQSRPRLELSVRWPIAFGLVWQERFQLTVFWAQARQQLRQKEQDQKQATADRAQSLRLVLLQCLLPVTAQTAGSSRELWKLWFLPIWESQAEDVVIDLGPFSNLSWEDLFRERARGIRGVRVWVRQRDLTPLAKKELSSDGHLSKQWQEIPRGHSPESWAQHLMQSTRQDEHTPWTHKEQGLPRKVALLQWSSLLEYTKLMEWFNRYPHRFVVPLTQLV